MKVTKECYRANFDAGPTDDELKYFDALESPPVKPQTAKEASEKLIIWMEECNFSYLRAAQVLQITTAALVAATCGTFHRGVLLKMSNIVPEIRCQ